MRKALRITLWVLGGIVVLLFVVLAFINTRSGKNFVRERAVAFLSNKLKTEVRIGELDYSLPKMIVLRDVLLLDQTRDTLLAAREMRLNIAMLKLLNSNVSIQEVYLNGAYAHIYRNAPDSTFNFDYIVKAFLTQGEDTAVVQDTSARLTMNLDRLVLHEVRFRMDDYTGGSQVYFNVGELNLTMEALDPERMIFHADRLYGNNITASIINDKSLLPPSDDTVAMPDITANEIHLRNISYNQQDLVNQFFMDIRLTNLLAHPGEMSLPGQTIALKDLRLDTSYVKVLMKGRSAELAEQIGDTIIDADPAPQVKWYVNARQLNLNGLDFILDNENEQRLPSGVDFAHLNVTNAVLDADGIVYTTDSISGRLQHFAAAEKSGLQIHELKTIFSYHPQGGYLRDLYLQTNNTILQDYVSVRYPSPNAVAANPALLEFDLNLKNSIVGLKDVLLFAPQLESDPFFRKHRNGRIRLEADADGRLSNITLHHLYASGLGNTEAKLSGRISDVMDPDRLSYDLRIQKLQSSRNDIELLLPPAALEQVRLPDRFGATGTLAGTANTYRPNLYLVTTDGNASLRGMVSIAGGTGRERYDIAIKTDRLNLGRMLKQDTMLGTVTADIVARGRSFDINTMNAVARGKIHAATFKGYTYTNVAVNGNIAGKIGQAHVVSEDPNAQLNMAARFDLRGDHPSITTEGVVQVLDLHALGFFPSPLRIAGNIYVDIEDLNPDYPRGTVYVADPAIAANGKSYVLDTLSIVAAPTADSGNNIIVRSDLLNAHVWGKTPLTKIGDIVSYHIDRHYVLHDSTGSDKMRYRKRYNIPADYDLQLQARVEHHPLVQLFVPDLRTFDTIRLAGQLAPEQVSLDVDAPGITYATFDITDAKVRVKGNDSALTYVASVDHIKQKTIDVWYANASGRVRTNRVTTTISVADADSVQKFRLHASLTQEEKDQVLQFHRGLMLNYQEWDVQEPNRIVFGEEGFYVQNFGINNGAESIMVNSQSPAYNAPLRADISNFMLSNITNVISKDTLLANGMLAGYVNLERFNPDPEVNSVLGITNFSMMGDTIGNIDINVHSASANAVDANVGITGNGNDIRLNGSYYPAAVNGDNFDMSLVLNPMNVATFEGAAMHQIRNTSGYLRGQLQVNGTLTAPVLRGNLQTDSLSTNVAMLNTQFLMPKETISFNGQEIALNNFQVLDARGNPATLDGSIITKNFADMTLAMRVRARDWQVMNSTARDNEEFYGQLMISANATVNGPAMAPRVDGSLNVLEGTSLTVVVPQYEAGIQERDGIVRFVDMDHPDRYKLFVNQDTTPKWTALAPGADINMNISADEAAEFNLIIDQGTGDFVHIRGKADLNTSVSPDGTLGIVGSYEIVDGTYNFNYNFIKRLFRIQPGSTITFSGDPTQAEVNATAIYEANVPPYDLVSRQIDDPSELVYYQQRLPFEVQLKLTGPIMQPVIAFDVVLPEGKNYRIANDVEDVVRARLAQIRQTQSELNKQVFALIILNRFVTDNVFESGVEGGGLENVARQSVSRFISEQLNQVASGLIEGLDLTVDLTTSEDYTTGERRNRTDLTVGASKRLLNDRLTVTVGNNFQVEGPRTNNAGGGSVIPGNITIDYDISSDRAYKLRFFRRNEDMGVFEGFVVETGGSVIMQKDYNRVRQIFMSRKKRERMREERRQRMEERRRQQENQGQYPAEKAAVVLPKREESETH